MNNEQQTWILKPEHEVIPGERNGYRWVTLLAPGEDVRGTATTMNAYGFEKHFVPLDVSGLTRQIEELIYPFIEMSEREGYYALENRELFHELDEADSATDVIVNKLLALLGGTTNE